MAEHYLVDGYNVVHHSSVLRPLAHKNFEAAREAFVEKLVGFCLATRHRVTVIFDGRDQYARIHDSQSARGVPGLAIEYSPDHLSADAVIERMVYAAPKRIECIVVSNDNSLRNLCRGLGSLSMDADHFIKSVRQHQGQLREGLAMHSRNAAQPNLLEDRLDASTMEGLKALRERLDKKKRG
jgi:predicted RNA-binding protein with PIN domain